MLNCGIGQLVKAVRYPVASAYSPGINDALVRDFADYLASLPREIPVAQAIVLPDNFPSSAFGFQLLKVRGQILEIAPGLTETALVLKDGDTSFRAIVRGNSAHLALPDVHSVLDLTPASAKPLPAGTPTPSSAPPLALARTAVGALRSSQKQPDRVEMRSETVTYAA